MVGKILCVGCYHAMLAFNRNEDLLGHLKVGRGDLHRRREDQPVSEPGNLIIQIIE